MPILTLANLQNPATAAEWNAAMLTTAKTVGLPTTAWQPGSIERSVFAVVANIDREQGVSASVIAQAGFLTFSAIGYVDTVNPDGTAERIYVTPDPSIPAQNPTGALGWLDVLADGAYDVRRILSTFAGGTLALLNTSVTTYGPFTAGTYHVAQAGAPGAPTYANTASLTIAPSATIGSVTGAVASSGLIKITVTTHGLSTGAHVFLTGILGTTEANGAWVVTVTGANTFTLDGSTFTHTWSAGGTQTAYTPTTAPFTADVAGTVSTAATPNVVATSVTSLIGVSVENVDGWLGTDIEGNVALAARCRLKLAALALNGPAAALEYFALTAQQLAPLLTPPQVLASAVTRALVVLDVTTGTAVLTIANSSGTSSGPVTVVGTDCYVVNAVELANTVLFTSTLLVQAAVPHAVAVVPTVFLPAAYNTTATKTIIFTAISLYFQALAIGGVTDPGGATNVVPIEGVENAIDVALAAASIPHQDMTITLNGVAANVQLLVSPVPEVATLTSVATDIVLISV